MSKEDLCFRPNCYETGRFADVRGRLWCENHIPELALVDPRDAVALVKTLEAHIKALEAKLAVAREALREAEQLHSMFHEHSQFLPPVLGEKQACCVAAVALARLAEGEAGT